MIAVIADYSPHELTLEFGPPLGATRRFTLNDDGLLLFKLRRTHPLHGYAYLRDDWWNYVSLGVRELDLRFTVLINNNTAILAEASHAFDTTEQQIRFGEVECRLADYREWKRRGAPDRCYVRLKASRRSPGAQSAAA